MRRSISFLTLVVIVGSMYVACENPALKGAKIYLQRSEMEKAKEQLLVVVNSDPANFEAQFLLGELYYNESAYKNMNVHFDASINTSDRYKGAIDDYRLSAFTKVYGDASRYLNAGYEETDADKKKLAFELSIAEMEKAYAILADSRALEGQAVGYYALENDAEAERLFEKVLDDDPENLNSLLQLGNMKFNKAEGLRVDEGADKDQLDPLYTDALRYFQQYRAVQPEQNERIIANIAWCYTQLGETDRAIDVYQQILDAEPDNEDIVIQLGLLKYKMGDFDGALADFKSALASRPDDFNLLQTVGQTLWNNLIPKVNSDTEKFTKEEITLVLPYIEKIIEMHEEDNDTALSVDSEYIFTQALFTLYNKLYEIEPTPELEKKRDDAFTKFSDAVKKKG